MKLWGDLQTDTCKLLQQLAATFGLEWADRVVDALRKELEQKLHKIANERTDLVLVLMEWGESQQWPRVYENEFTIQEGLQAW